MPCKSRFLRYDVKVFLILRLKCFCDVNSLIATSYSDLDPIGHIVCPVSVPGPVSLTSSVPELANLDGKRHPMDIVFPLFPSKFTMDFPLSSTENIISCNN